MEGQKTTPFPLSVLQHRRSGVCLKTLEIKLISPSPSSFGCAGGTWKPWGELGFRGWVARRALRPLHRPDLVFVLPRS